MNPSLQRVAAPAPAHEPRLWVVEPGARVVKRYANRKLYDTAASRYVKLDEIAELIRAGVEVKVLDHASGRDVTSAALAHIIFDEEVRASQRRAGVLADVIRAEGARPAGVVGEPCGDPCEALRRAEERSRRVVAEADRARACTRRRLHAAEVGLERLREAASARTEAAREVLDGLARARRDLGRMERRLDALHERLRGMPS